MFKCRHWGVYGANTTSPPMILNLRNCAEVAFTVNSSRHCPTCFCPRPPPRLPHYCQSVFDWLKLPVLNWAMRMSAPQNSTKPYLRSSFPREALWRIFKISFSVQTPNSVFSIQRLLYRCFKVRKSLLRHLIEVGFSLCFDFSLVVVVVFYNYCK